MNPVLDVIQKRRSIRSYLTKSVTKETLLALIDAANLAPSGMNLQPWRFVVVEDAGFRRKLLKTAIPNSKKFIETFIKESNPKRYEQMMRRYEELDDPVYYGAPAMIFVIGSGPHAPESCPMACENIMLAAHSLGIGSCWVKFGSMITDNPEVVSALELKEGEIIYGPILLGYPKDIPNPPPKKAPVIKWI